MLIHVRNVLTRDEVLHCRQVLEAAGWVEGALTSGEQARKVKRNLQVPPESEAARQLGDLILRALGRNPTFNSAALPLRVLPPLFNRYDVGMKFGAHVDGAIRAMPGSGFRMRNDMSSTLFLTDPAEYDGGELVIEDSYGSHEVKLPAGDMILYPTTSLHSVREVTRGARWSSFFWTQSMVKSNENREILHDMDQAIMQMREAMGDEHPAVLKMTNTYHNLLRQWSDL